MRLVLIIALGSILIGAAYAWSGSLNKAGDDAEFSQVYKKNVQQKTVTKTSAPILAQATEGGEPSGNSTPSSEAVTNLEAARASARAQTGNKDPFEPVVSTESFPRGSAKVVPTTGVTTTTDGTSKVKQLTVVPPPPGSSDFGNLPGPHNGFLPPPVPGVLTGSALSTGLSMKDLPSPPSRPSTARYLRLTGIIGDKAIFQIKDLSARRSNHWPAQVTLGPGDDFGSLRLVSVSSQNESAIVEEHGRQEELHMPALR